MTESAATLAEELLRRILQSRKPAAINLFDLDFWKPYPGKQAEYFRSDAWELLYGGAAGPGKTDCLIIDALKYVNYPEYNALLFRRTITDLSRPDGIIDRTHRYYPHLGGVYNGSTKRWTFPSGAVIALSGLEAEKDIYKFQGAQIQFLGFDELTHFTERQFKYMLSRVRRPHRDSLVPTRVRCASNPGGIGHDWVKARYITSDISERKRWYINEGGEDVEVNETHPAARSRRFIFATHSDNPALDPDYIRNLRAMDSVDQARLIGGDWDATYRENLVYPQFSSIHNVSERADYNPDLDVIIAIDDGYNPNPRAVLMFQEWPDDTLTVFDEMYVTGELHRETFDKLFAMIYYVTQEPSRIYYDPSATLMGAMLARDYGQTIHAAYNKIADGIKGVRREILDARGVRRLLIHPRCKNLIREFGQYRYHESQTLPNGDPRPVKEHDHAMDALRYMIATHRMWRNAQE